MNVPQDSSMVEALDFSLVDTAGRLIRLSDFRDQKHVVLVFNRGFA